MVPWAILKKALRVRRKMFALAKAKEASIRELAGLPPVMPWFQACWVGCMSTIRVTCCRAFCPCYIGGKLRFMDFFCPRTWWCGRLFYDGMYENEVMKNILGFIAGMGLSLLLYAWLCLHKDYPPLYAAVFGIIGGVILTLGMAFSLSVRCLVFLTLPQMFSKKGRNFLLMYAAVLVFTYPVANFNTNMQVMANSATCGQELMINETMKLVQFATDPLAAVYDALKELLLAIKRFARMLMKAFKALIRALKEICAAVAKVFKWLYSLVDICNEKMGAPYRKCKKAFDDAYSDCRDRLGIFKFLCEIVDAASNLCHIVRVGELLCAIGGAVKDLVVSSVEKATTGTVGDLYTMFYFNVTMEHNFTYTINQSRSYTEVKDAIMAEIKAKIESFSGVMSVLDNVMMLTVFTIFTKAWSYRTRYLTKDKYDNYYITEYVHEMDARRKELGRECIFPLKESENLKYIPLTSFKVTAKEGRKMLKGLAFWAFGAYYSAIYLIMDYSLYWVLDMVSRALNVKTSAEIPAYLQLHVNGKGPMADMYKTMVGMLDPVAAAGLDIDSTPCLPIPSPPDMVAYRLIIFIYVFCLFLAMGEAYGLRLRRAVAACYYPQRERERAVWLYNHILYTRGGFFKFARRQLRRKYMNETEIQKMSVRGRIVRECPCLGKIVKLCGYERKACLLCGREGRLEDRTNFTHCGNHGCSAVYCNDCYDELNNLCTVCMNPVDYGDLSDASEEIDSSEDEDVIRAKKEKAKERRARREAKQKEKRPSQMVNKFKGLFGVPVPQKQPANMQRQGKGEAAPLMGSDDDSSGSDDVASGKGGHSSGTETSSGTEEYDTDYQHANKSQLTTSTEETESESESSSDKTAPRAVAGVTKRKPAYETLGIFNSDFSGSSSTSVQIASPSPRAPDTKQVIQRQ